MMECEKFMGFRERGRLARTRPSSPLDGVGLGGFDDGKQITAVSVPRDAHGRAIRYAVRHPRAVQNLKGQSRLHLSHEISPYPRA